MKKKIDVKVMILEDAGDKDRYLVRWNIPEQGLYALEWVSLTGLRQWVATAKKIPAVNMAVAKAILEAIEKKQKEGEADASKTNPKEDGNGKD